MSFRKHCFLNRPLSPRDMVSTTSKPALPSIRPASRRVKRCSFSPATPWWTGMVMSPRSFLSKERGDMTMPVHQGVAGLKLHLFTRREAGRMLGKAGFDVVETMSLGLNGRLRKQCFLKDMRSYGFLLCGQRPAAE